MTIFLRFLNLADKTGYVGKHTKTNCCCHDCQQQFVHPLVELEGVEPSSKQGNHTLSTRLFQPLVFVLQQDLDHQLQPYPLNFIRPSRPVLTISDLPAPLDPQIRNNTLGAMSRSIT